MLFNCRTKQFSTQHIQTQSNGYSVEESFLYPSDKIIKTTKAYENMEMMKNGMCKVKFKIPVFPTSFCIASYTGSDVIPNVL
jgi:hypothetical protein